MLSDEYTQPAIEVEKKIMVTGHELIRLLCRPYWMLRALTQILHSSFILLAARLVLHAI